MRAVTINEPLEVVKVGKHEHPPNQDEIKSKKIYAELKEEAAAQPEARPSALIREKLSTVESLVLPLLPERESMKRTLNKRRIRNFPKNPTHITALKDIPPQFRQTNNGDNFIIFDSYDAEDNDTSDEEDDLEFRDPNRIIVFGTNENLSLLSRSRIIFLDGTFKTCPKIFTQIFTVHGTLNDVVLPLVYALLPNKTTESYQAVLRSISGKCLELGFPALRPQSVMSDFELGIINSVRQIFPRSIILLCFFHLKQSVWRHLQELGLQVAYNDPENREVKVKYSEMLALAFVPVDDVPGLFAILKPTFPENMTELANYFDRTYVNGSRQQVRRRWRTTPPRYAPVLWNHYDTVLTDGPRTNNATEGWHNRFQTLIGKNHPSLYYLLQQLRAEQADMEKQVIEIHAGRKVRKARERKYNLLNARLRTIVGRYEVYKAENRQMDYLRGIGHNIADTP